MHWVDGLGGGVPGGLDDPPRGMHRTPLRNAVSLWVSFKVRFNPV